jgi:hypothetical protein
MPINPLQCNVFLKDQKIAKLVETTISSVVEDSDDLKNVYRDRVKKLCDFVFIKSKNDDYALSIGQKFLYCKLLKCSLHLPH